MDVHLIHIAGAAGRKYRRERRRQDLVDAQGLGDPAGMQRAVAAVSEHGEIPGLVTARAQFGRDAIGHVGIDRLLDQLDDVDHFQLEVIAQMLLDGLARSPRVELDASRRVVLRVEVTQQQIGVGHRRTQATMVVAGRSGIRAGALRSDLHGLVHPIELGDRAAPSAKRLQVHHRNRHHPAIDHRIEVVVLDAALNDDADVEAGASHIRANDIAEIGLRGEVFLESRHPRHRPGMHRLQRISGVELRHTPGVVVHQHGLAITRLRAG